MTNRMPVEDEVVDRISGRFVARASEVGFSVPPVALRLKLNQSEHYWTLMIQAVPAGPAHGIVEWLEPFAPLRFEFGSRNVLRADFDPLPRAWATAFRGIDLDMLQLDTAGQAFISVSGPRAAIAAFTRRVRGPTVRLDIRHVGPAPLPAHLLTQPQDQALRAAVQSGYYLIPRPVNLRALAKLLTISSASLSERLRRAEGRVVTRYVNEGGRSPWDDSTLYDDRPFAPNVPPWLAEGEVEVQ